MSLTNKFDQTYKELVQAKNKWEDFIKNDGLTLVKDLMREFFTSFPEVKELSLIGFTPYFNDGDACTFGLWDMKLKLSSKAPEEMRKFFGLKDEEEKDEEEKDEEEWEEDERELETYELRGFLREKGQQYQLLVNNILNGIDKVSSYISDDMFLLLWDDHTQVRFTKDNITSEQYSHD